MNLFKQFARSVVLTFFVVMIWIQALLADDIWSPGSGGQVWERITRLQSVGVKSQVRSPFVTDSCSSDDPVERLAAIAWIGRTRSEKHIPDLERLLADKISQVRQLAFEALLGTRRPSRKEASIANHARSGRFL